ncbi:MAG: hypothetical protein R3D69_05170 [Xanthobacteraceae bacterium]
MAHPIGQSERIDRLSITVFDLGLGSDDEPMILERGQRHAGAVIDDKGDLRAAVENV